MLRKGRLWLILLLSFLLLSLLLKPFFISLLRFPLSFITASYDKLRKLTPYYKLRRKIAEQEQLIIKLQNQILKFHEMEKELARLKKLLELKEEAKYPLITADVIAMIRDGNSQILLIDKGLNHGVRKNRAVISLGGLVGRVLEVESNVSKVLLISDPSSLISVRIGRTRDLALLRGIGINNYCELLYLSPDSPTEVTDKVYTSGKGGIFPAGIPIGEIVSISWDRSGLHKKAKVKPFIDFDKIEEVMVKGE